jgi:hypothetical protein
VVVASSLGFLLLVVGSILVVGVVPLVVGFVLLVVGFVLLVVGFVLLVVGLLLLIVGLGRSHHLDVVSSFPRSLVLLETILAFLIVWRKIRRL